MSATMSLNLNFQSKLPTVKECIDKILLKAKTPSDIQDEARNEITNEVYSFWTRIFGADNVIHKNSVRKRFKKILEKFDKQVYKTGNTRSANEIFFSDYNKTLDLLKSDSKLSPKLQMFYADQMSSRIYIVADFEQSIHIPPSNKIQLGFQEESAIQRDTSLDLAEEEYIPQSGELVSGSRIINQRTLRSSFVTIKVPQCSVSSQVDVNFTPNIRNNRNLTDKIKITLALACVDAGITPEQSRKAFKSIAKNFFGAEYYLDANEVPKSDQNENDEKENDPKKFKSDFYEFVLPSYRTVCDTKHSLALNQERNVALTLLEKQEDIKVSAHFDTTSRGFLNYEWPSLILELSNGQTFSLKPLPIGVEDRDAIVDFFVAEMNRLAMAAGTTANLIWETIDSLATDSVSKNLDIGPLIAKKLNSKHVPFHVLCNTHYCEAIDRGNLKTIKMAETAVGLKDHLICLMPELKSFIGSKTCTEAALLAFTKLCCNDGHNTSQYQIFDAVLAENQRNRKFTVFKERRFGQMGYTAAAVIYHLNDIRELLLRTKSNNTLVRACKVYVENSYILNGLRSLSIFCYKVTLPFMNFMEKETQIECVKMIPTLYNDFKVGNLETLKHYVVDFSFPISEENDTIKFLLIKFCEQAASDLKQQKGREYGLDDDKRKRATDLTKLAENELRNLPTNNIICERQLGRVDHLLARSSKTSSKVEFKGIQDTITLMGATKNIEFDKREISRLKLLLDQQYKMWMKMQDENLRNRLDRNNTEKIKIQERGVALLTQCKVWYGPCTTEADLQNSIQSYVKNDKDLKKLLKTEISFRKITSPNDFAERPELFRLNKLTNMKLQENLLIIFNTTFLKISDIPDEEDGLEKIKNYFEMS